MRSSSSKNHHPSALALASLLLFGLACGRPEAPQLTASTPAADAVDVPLNAKVLATFGAPMQPLPASAFTLSRGTTSVAGTLATSVGGTNVTFSPSAQLEPATVYTATITTDAKTVDGVALAMNRTWKFTTGSASDVTAPLVTATSPPEGSLGVALNANITATFSEAMDPLSITTSTFVVRHGQSEVPGNIVYGPGTTAVFKSAGALGINALFTVTLGTGIRDMQGNALANARTWSFTTGSASSLGPASVELGTAGSFAVLAKSAISTVPSSVITGDIGLGPAAASYLTGFSLVADATNVFAMSPQVTGRVYAASYAVPTPADLTTAIANMETAYTDAASRPTPDHLELSSGNLGGLTLAPGLYKWTSTITIDSDVTVAGGANDRWIFQTTGDLSLAASKRVILSGGAQAKNVVWQVAGKVTLGATSHFEGVILCMTEVTLQTGATLNGRVLAQTQVALQQATVTQPAQ